MQGNIVNLGGGDDLFFYKSQNISGNFHLSWVGKRYPPWGSGEWREAQENDMKIIMASYQYSSDTVHTRGFTWRGKVIVWSDGTLSQLVEDFTDLQQISKALLDFKRELFDETTTSNNPADHGAGVSVMSSLIGAASLFGVGKLAPLVVPNSHKKAGILPKEFDREFVFGIIDDALYHLQQN